MSMPKAKFLLYTKHDYLNKKLGFGHESLLYDVQSLKWIAYGFVEGVILKVIEFLGGFYNICFSVR